MKTERKMYVKMLTLFVILLSAIMMGILSLYWGADHSLQFTMPAATIAIIDLDGGEVGPALSTFSMQFRREQGPKSLGYITPPASQYPSNEMASRALYEEDVGSSDWSPYPY